MRKESEIGHKNQHHTHTLTNIIKVLQGLQIGGYHKMQRPKCEHNRNVWWWNNNIAVYRWGRGLRGNAEYVRAYAYIIKPLPLVLLLKASSSGGIVTEFIILGRAFDNLKLIFVGKVGFKLQLPVWWHWNCVCVRCKDSEVIIWVTHVIASSFIPCFWK